MLSIKPKIAYANILDVLSSMAIRGHFDRYRKNIVLNLVGYFTRPYPFYFHTNGFYRPVSSVATTLLSLREVWGSLWAGQIGHSVASDSPPLQHIFVVRSCGAQALSRGALSLIPRFGV